SRPGFTSDHNAVMNRLSTNGGSSSVTLAQWQAATGQDANSFVATPAQLFVDPANRGYPPPAGSPAIGAGTAQAAPGDALAGNAREQVVEGRRRPWGRGGATGPDEDGGVGGGPQAPPPLDDSALSQVRQPAAAGRADVARVVAQLRVADDGLLGGHGKRQLPD